MPNFELLSETMDPSALRDQLKAHPELWNANPGRLGEGSPHAQAQDIWVRFRDRAELKEPADFAAPHQAVWYPCIYQLPAAVELVTQVVEMVGARELGGVLITKIPPGKKILPHHDRGGWHAEYYNCKIYVPIQSDEDCINYCEDEMVCMLPGTAWIFDNLKVHSVENNGTEDRMTLIICTRVG
jgi:hypothetical protein